jgi:hypothetical protein
MVETAAMYYMQEQAGKLFDPLIVPTFMEMIKERVGIFTQNNDPVRPDNWPPKEDLPVSAQGFEPEPTN